MKKIMLTKGKQALVDDEDFVSLNKMKWFFDGTYAARKNPNKIYLHRIIMKPEGKLIVDHINGNTLDNRKSNLRCVTRSENGLNRKNANRGNVSGHLGVVWFKRDKLWQAQAFCGKKYVYLGRFKRIEDAIKTRNNYIKHYE